MEKKCNKCNVVKDVSEFGKRKEGLRNHCKGCIKIYQKKPPQLRSGTFRYKKLKKNYYVLY